MNWENYKHKMEYPEQPKKPVEPKKPSGLNPAAHENYAKAIVAYAEELKKYAVVLEEWRKRVKDYGLEEMRLQEIFKADALADTGLDKHPKRDDIYSYAWSKGHSGGLNDVWCELSDIAHLFKD